MTSADPKLLELAPEEISVPLKVSRAGHAYRVCHRLRPPAAPDWLAYEAALQLAVEELPPESESGEPGYRFEMRSSEAALELWGRLIRGVEGYELPEEAEWQSLIPLAHKEAAVRALTLVAPAAAAAPGANGFFPLRADEVPVVLEAALGGRAYPRLVHRFRPPSVEDERAYRRLLAENLVVRGARHPRTLIPARLPALVRLYDRLILGVEGYAINNQPPASKDQLLTYMDAWHKRVAVETLFGGLAAEAPVTAASPAEELIQ